MAKSKRGRENEGRPTSFTPELGAEICRRIATGESVRSIGRDEAMPDASTIHRWVLDDAEFYKQYARAKEIGGEVEAETLEEIARTEKDVQRARLIVDTKKWVMSKKLPKKYGDKLDMTSGGEPMQPVLVRFIDAEHNGHTEGVSTPL